MPWSWPGTNDNGCSGLWNDRQHDQAVRVGSWVDRETGIELFEILETTRPKKIALHLPAWVSPFVGLSECAAAFLRGLKSKTKHKDFQNNYAAMPWVDYHVEPAEDAILALRDERPRCQVPGGGVVSCLLGSADTQDDGFYYEVRAWGWGQELESWQVREGFVPTLDALAKIFFADRYQDADGNKWRVELSLIDVMGHRTAEVYEWCWRYRNYVIPLQGRDRRQKVPITYTKIKTFPGTRRRFIGEMHLVQVKVDYYKDKLVQKLEIAPTDPGAWHFHSETTSAWAERYTAEYFDPSKGSFICRPGIANHAWDLATYQLAVADIVDVSQSIWPEPKKEENNIRVPFAVRRAKSSCLGGIYTDSWISTGL
jgi:phage terminase large subunit GpA-like protein